MSRINPLRWLYNSLSEQLSEDDERSLRNLLRGDQVKIRDLESLKSPAEIFINLEESGHISITDLELLKELLEAIKRLPLVTQVEKVERELQGCQLERGSNEEKVKSIDCLGAEGGGVNASSAVDVAETQREMLNVIQDPDGYTTSLQHHLDKHYLYSSQSSLDTGLQRQISVQEHKSSTENKEDLPQDAKYDQIKNSAASTSSKSTHDEDVILKCQEKLRKEYKRLSHILPLPWLDGADSRLKLEDIYTQLDLQDSDGTIVQRKDIFSCSGDDENPKRILIEGDPGYGKSTFCKMIAYDWAKSKTEYLRNFKLLFLSEFKDIQQYHSENNEKQSLKDFIFDLVLRDVKEKQTLWSFIDNNQLQVCFIFDGLDEVSSNNLPVYFKRMVQQKWPLLPDCHVIVTSRIIRDVDSGHLYDGTFSIKGFDEVKAELFVKSYLGCHTGKVQKISNAERFLQELGGSRSRLILYRLMQSPLNTLMLCEIWKQNKELPHFITEIYKAIVEYTVKRYCKNTREYRTFNDTEIKQTLLFLGKKSYEGLLSERGQVLLSDNEIKSQPYILQLGFLSKPSTSLQGYSFMHLIYQEYFAALYIADLCSTNHSKFADIIDVSVFLNRKCSNITLVFVAGLLKDKQSKMFEVWYRKIGRTVNAFDPILILQETGFVTAEIISLCAKVLPCSLDIDITMLESPHNKCRLEIIKLLLQCSDIRSDRVIINVSASNSNACEIYSACRVCLKANSKKIEVRLKIDCDLSKCAIKHFLNDIVFASDPYTDDIANLHIRNHKDIDILHSIQDILDVFSKINAKTHVISGLPFRLKLIDAVLMKLNDARSLHSVRLVFGEQKKIFIFEYLTHMYCRLHRKSENSIFAATLKTLTLI
ncbi:NACHT, LRR and PYD domains-containing protein 1 homolog [Ptychodera flava]|uniref:NACHT, LRR and PYD domains-containing protein 1 homolog n=1 Tax=Ptychodera flava TaxID=63121 RepID=UPI00396A6920